MGDKKPKGVYIANIECKDLRLANELDPKNGYHLKRANGEMNLYKFINQLDYSLDLMKLREVYAEVYGENPRKPFSWFDKGGKEYSTVVINLTFKYSVKTFNKIGSGIYVKLGHSIAEAQFEDCIARSPTGEIIAVQTDKAVKEPAAELPKGFVLAKSDDDLYGHYATTAGIKTVMNVGELRRWAYVNGFNVDGVHYRRFKRSSGAARRGVCNFIVEKLYPKMHEWEKCGLDIKQGQPIDLAGIEAYFALTSSSIIGTVQLDPKSILVIDDYKSKFTDTVMATEEVDNHYSTAPKTMEIENKIWDGQSLMDTSVFGEEYGKYGMLLLRNRFFKSCCFHTNLQKWFADNGITDVSQLQGRTRAEKIEDVKLITTPSSIKYLKFGTLDQWLDNVDSTWGVVKHDKPPKYVRHTHTKLHYQLCNTLQMTFEETKELLRPSLEYVMALREDPAVLREYVQYSEYEDCAMLGAEDKNGVIYACMMLNDDFTKTKMYAEFVKSLVKSQYDSLKTGHILEHGAYCTLAGNVTEMLKAAIGTFDGHSDLGVGNIHCSFFSYGRKLIGSRSPHVTMGNVWLPNNVESEEIDKYFHVTPYICYMNSIDENVLSRLSGSDKQHCPAVA